MISKLILKTYLKVYLGPWTHAFLITRQRVARTVWIFLLRFLERPFSCLVGEAASPLIKSTPAFWSGCHLPIIGIFIFLNVSFPTPWPFEKKIEGSYPFLGVPLLLFLCLTFSKKAPKLSYNLMPTSMQSGWSLPSNPLRVLRSCCWVVEASDRSSLVAFLWDSCTLVSLHYRFTKVLGGTALLLWAKSQEFSSVPYIPIVSWRRSSWLFFFPSIRRGFLCIRLSSYYVEEKIIR